MKKLFLIILFAFVMQFEAFAQFDEGVKSAQSQDYQTALEQFQNSLSPNLSAKKQAQFHYNIGVCFYQLNQADKAVTEFKQAVRLYPKYQKAFYALGMAQVDLKQFEAAEKAFHKSLKFAQTGETWFDLALVQFALKKYDESAQGFRNAINFGSESIAASRNNLGVIYALQGKFDAAEHELKIARELRFDEAENNLNIIHKLLETNDQRLIAKLILKEKKNDER